MSARPRRAQDLAWGDLQVFVNTARGGTLAAAAESLGVNPSTVQRRIGKLERDLDTRLFDRSQRGYSLTSAGQALYGHAQAIEREVVALSRKVGGQDQRLEGLVRVATVDDMAIGPLAPIIRDFRALHPQVEIELSIRSDFADLSRRQADVAIRFGAKPSDPDVVARRLVRCDVALYGSRAYFRRHGRPKTLEELRDHVVVRGTERLARLPMERIIAEYCDPEQVALRSESLLVRLAAIREGLGLGFLGLFMGEVDRRLERLPLHFPSAASTIWLAVHADLRTNARVRTFADFVRSKIDAQRERFELQGSHAPER